MGRLKNFNREDVLDEAIQLFWKKGYSDTSLSDLEKATGVNKSGLYSEFKDKDDIFLESLKRYRENSQATKILRTEPLGIQNIRNMMTEKMNCKGQKGCFLANTVREYGIIPPKMKALLDDNSKEINELVIANIKAAGIKNSDLIAAMAMTFMTGMCLKLNAVKPDQVLKEIESFISLISSSKSSS
jgi:AcrR family transcriptional regulator